MWLTVQWDGIGREQLRLLAEGKALIKKIQVCGDYADEMMVPGE